MKTLYLFIILFIYLIVISNVSTSVKSTDLNMDNSKLDPLKYKAGQRIFQRNCAVCHGLDKKMIAGPLNTILDDHNSEWIYNYISDDKSFMLIDSTARKINTKVNLTVASHHFKSEISKKDLKSLLYFIKANSTK